MRPNNLDDLVALIKTKTGVDGTVYTGIANEPAVRIPADKLREVVTAMMDDLDITHLSAITAQQRGEEKDLIELIYHFWQGSGIAVMMSLPVKSPQVDSLIDIIRGADFYEREVAEMFGVQFAGRKETPPLLLPDEWDQGPPFMSNEEGDV